eukprot:gene19219-25070_t
MDRYDPIRVLGEGSFGKVYLMRDKVKRNLLCIKVIKIKNIPKKEREATKMEVDLLRRLHHPNIVRYVDSFLSKNNETLCICMEYCDGGDLASQIKAARRNLFSESKVLHWFVQIALGLQYMHNNKVLHRDLKTQNVFLLGNGRLVLGDLGISKVLDGTMDFAQTCIGTPYYMSPEIFKNKPYSYKSDVWALGCVLYEMTTLTHAFDANSLNGLATKIIKGRYPSINSKYSKYLRDLITEMLMTNPQQRPDLDNILKKVFIKKHIVNFFVDVMSRPNNSISEGTMIVKGAIGGQIPNNISNDNNMLSLKSQLISLDLMDAVNEALNPKAVPNDYNEAKKLAKDQMSALKREQEHKLMVENALERLRIERENKSKERMNLLNKPRNPSNVLQSPSAINNPIGRQPSRVIAQQPLQQPPPILPIQQQVRPSPSQIVADSLRKEKEKLDREKRLNEEKRKQLIQQQISNDINNQYKYEMKRKEDIANEIKIREAKQLQQQQLQQQQQQFQQQQLKQQQQQIQLQQQQREQLRFKERQRQLEEIEQLKRDKLELDKRQLEKERLRNERRIEEKRKIESNRKDIIDNQPDKQADKFIDKQIDRPLDKPIDKFDDDKLSARERVLQRKLEKQAKEEQERLEAIKEIENENRRNRQQMDRAIDKPVDKPSDTQETKYEFDSVSNRNKGRFISNNSSNSNNMNVDEISRRLSEITTSRQNKYDPNVSNYDKQPSLDISNLSDDDELPWDNQVNQINDPNNIVEVEDVLLQREVELQKELEISTIRLEELQKTLDLTKSILVVNKVDKRINQPIDRNVDRPIVSEKIKSNIAARNKPNEEDYDDDWDDDDYYYDDNDNNDEESFEPPLPSTNEQHPILPIVPPNQSVESLEISVTPRRNQKTSKAIKPSPYEDLVDSNTPNGKLSDRIKLLRQRCIDALGREPFLKAYKYLTQQDGNETKGYFDDDIDKAKMSVIRSILGEGKVHYTTLIEQLIFMEETALN